MKFTSTFLLLGTIRSELNFNDTEAFQDLSQSSDSTRRSNNYYNSYFDEDVEDEPMDSFDESDDYNEGLDSGVDDSINTVNSPSRSESHCVVPNTPCKSGHGCTANEVAICNHGLWVNIPCGNGLKCGNIGGSYFSDWTKSEYVKQ